MIKRMGFFLLLVLVLALGSAFAHDKGDLMLNVEPQIGFSLPDIGVRSDGVLWSDAIKNTKQFGMNLGLNITAHYYFFNFFALNAGAGFLFNLLNVYYAEVYPSTDDYSNFSFTNGYVTIPFGVRLSGGAFAAGLGMAVNIPVSGKAKLVEKYGGDKVTLTDKKYSQNTYTAWYIDLGFDMSGKKDREGGFGMLARVSAPFSGPIATTKYVFEDDSKLSYDPFTYVSVSLVFQAAIQMGNYPIGGKK